MPEAERSIEVNTKPKVLYDIIADFERYSEFVPEMKRATVLAKSKNQMEVEFEVSQRPLFKHGMFS